MELRGIWGDKYSLDGLNVKIEKNDGKIFWLSQRDLFRFVKMLDLQRDKEEIEEKIKKLNR